MIKILKRKKDMIILERPTKNEEYFTSPHSYNKHTTKQNKHYKTSINIKFFNYSTTTNKHLTKFSNKTKAQTQAKINSGEYILTDLN